ncbi:MAG: outer membrane protein, partial [Candidatus Aminicenantales bacterium]
SAQTESSGSGFSLAASGGVFFPLGTDFEETYLRGPGGGLTIGYELLPAVQLFFDLSYQHLPLDHDIFSSSYTVTGGNFEIFSIGPGVKFYLPIEGRFGAYAMAGAGLFVYTVGALTVSAPGYEGLTRDKETETAFGYILGGGLEYRLTNTVNLLGELRFTDIFPGSKSGEDAVHLRHFSFRLGARLKF